MTFGVVTVSFAPQSRPPSAITAAINATASAPAATAARRGTA
jgi:hypothetical protein